MEPTLRTLSPSYRRHLLASNRSAKTVETYVDALEGLTRYLEAQLGSPNTAQKHLEGLVALRLARTERKGNADYYWLVPPVAC